MDATRRIFTAALASLAAAPAAGAEGKPDPQLRIAEWEQAKVYIMGFATAEDRSWLTPKIARAADASGALWVEVPPLQPGATPSPVIAERGYDREHDLFQVLPAKLSARLLALAPRLGLSRERLAPMRPWLARQAVQRAFVAARPAAAAKAAPAADYPDQVMMARFQARGAPIRAEFASLDAVLTGFSDYPPQAQVEDLQNLLDYIDDDAKGDTEDGYGWVYGKPTDRYLDRIRLETPALYAASHVGRNRWWAETIERLLIEGGINFVLLGQNHVLGPDSVPVSLQRRGVATRFV